MEFEDGVARRMCYVVMLGLGWCMSMAGLFLNISMTSAAVTKFASPEQSTVPVGLHNISSAISLGVLSYYIIPRFGRRIVYILAGLLGAVGSALMIVGSRLELYGLLLAGTVLQGPAFGVAIAFRFDSAAFFPAPHFSQEWRTRSISITVGCAVLAVGIGIEPARVVRDNLGKDFTGGYTLLTGLYCAQALLTGLVDYTLIEQPQQQRQQQQPPPPHHQQQQDLTQMCSKGLQEAQQPSSQQTANHLLPPNPLFQSSSQCSPFGAVTQSPLTPPPSGHDEAPTHPPLMYARDAVPSQQQPPFDNRELCDSGQPHVINMELRDSKQPLGALMTPVLDDAKERVGTSVHAAPAAHSAAAHSAPAAHSAAAHSAPAAHYAAAHSAPAAHSAAALYVHRRGSHSAKPSSSLQLVPPVWKGLGRGWSGSLGVGLDQSSSWSGSDGVQPLVGREGLWATSPDDRVLLPNDEATLSREGASLPMAESSKQGHLGVSLRQALLRVEFLVPAISGATSFFTMAAIMSSTPLAMQLAGHSSNNATFTIEAHAGTMYVPSLLVADLVKLVRIIITATTTSKFMAVRLAACVVFLIPRLPARPQPQAQHRHLSQHPPPPCATLALQQQQQQPTGAITSTHGARADHNQPVGVSKLIHSAQAGSAHGLPGGVVTHTHGARADPDQVDCECPQGTHLGGHAAGSTQQGSTPFPENLPHNAPITFVMMLGSAILAASPGMLLAGTSFNMFMGGLALAGIGWALGYITASSLVTAAFSRPEFTRQQLQIAQMIMDICVLTSLAAGNATAGVIVRLWGWDQFLTLYLAILLALFVCNCVYHAYVVISYRCVAPPSLECSKLLITRSR